MAKSFIDRIKNGEILVLDGAMGTELQQRGLEPGGCGDRWNIEAPEKVQEVHKAYLDAGSDIIISNTFGSNPYRLKHYDLQDKTYEINKAGAELARRILPDENHYVFGDIGPSGEIMEASGGLTPYDDVYLCFKEQVLGLRDGKVDAIIVETMMALDEIICAVRAVKENSDLPVIASMSFSPGQFGYKSMMGIDAATFATELYNAGADVVGSNCGDCTIEHMIKLIAQMKAAKPDGLFMSEPNAGLPILQGTEVVYNETPEMMAKLYPELIKSGANIVGGCCGTTPAHIKALADVVAKLK
jgi:5-methyltetrahydrofolate--homocysteine methyltransferase